MRKLSAGHLLNIIEYEKVRNDYRNDIIEYKKNRRIKVGPNIAIVFENERTLSFQIQEICVLRELFMMKRFRKRLISIIQLCRQKWLKRDTFY